MAVASEWPKEAIQALIRSYREQPLLYDAKLTPLYYNKQARQAAITKILNVVKDYRPDTTSHEIIKKIQVLRTQYGQEITKIKKSKKYGEAFEYRPKIWWYPELDFLKDYMKTRPNPSKNESSDEETTSEKVSTRSSKRLRVSEENITIVDESGTPISDIATSSPGKSNKYVIYEDDSYADRDDPNHQSEIIVEPYTKPPEVKRHEEIGKFVATQMATIKDDILFYQTQHEILTVINNANLKQLEKNLKSGRSGVISVALETD